MTKDTKWMLSAYKRDHLQGKTPDDIDHEIIWCIAEGLLDYNPSTGLLNRTELGDLYIVEPAGHA